MQPLSAERSPSLPELQRYVEQMELARGLNDSSLIEQCLKLSEEAGEVCKAVRKHEALSIDTASAIGDLGHELADVLIYVAAIANRADIHLTRALGTQGTETLADLQLHVAERTDVAHPLIEQCLLLSAQVGDVCASALGHEPAQSNLADGLAGVLLRLTAISNRANLDLTQALRTKEEINDRRVWARPGTAP
ncbi:NTP pyrophosphatase, house-cleaning of non-canonical NTPs [Sinosporangium album]|uniref:NTP pyrophosphatase, house-cleaning of non-canonical NTPs n=1 Tax=Sinosporangium album TaxID=504805 RepID=A0A1G8LQU7_9ACTN|nr:MazG nucleotide pyrophosphohydrolase domain-containing protein [Sinosporangium album]SDI57847.1 NTP pyrophosphatase, house-cleaning of non-canonical NTPs [Sinosporangium album]